jgi:hypothetical protein
VIDLLIAAFGAAIIQTIRFKLSAALPSAWVRNLIEAPIALRFAIGLIIGYWLVSRFFAYSVLSSTGPYHNMASFRPVLIGALLMMLPFSALFPSFLPIRANKRKEGAA